MSGTTSSTNHSLRTACPVPESRVKFLRPRMDLYEDCEKNIVTATFEFPGVDKEEIEVELNNDYLTVSAETKKMSDRDEGGYVVRERYYGKLSRTLQLPQGVKEEEIKASMKDGVLTLCFPKRAPEASPRKITVS